MASSAFNLGGGAIKAVHLVSLSGTRYSVKSYTTTDDYKYVIMVCSMSDDWTKISITPSATKLASGENSSTDSAGNHYSYFHIYKDVKKNATITIQSASCSIIGIK